MKFKCPWCGCDKSAEIGTRDNKGNVTIYHIAMGCGSTLYPNGDMWHQSESCVRDGYEQKLKQTTKLFNEITYLLDNCPAELVLRTVPKAGIDVNPDQVVMTWHIGYLNYKAIKEAARSLGWLPEEEIESKKYYGDIERE